MIIIIYYDIINTSQRIKSTMSILDNSQLLQLISFIELIFVWLQYHLLNNIINSTIVFDRPIVSFQLDISLQTRLKYFKTLTKNINKIIDIKQQHMMQYMDLDIEQEDNRIGNTITFNQSFCPITQHNQQLLSNLQFFKDEAYQQPYSLISPLSYYHEVSQSNQILLPTKTQSNPQQAINNIQSQKIIDSQETPKKLKKTKNSNAIKKLGRLILDNLKDYLVGHSPNIGVSSMMRMLSKNSKVGRNEINKRDKFNTYHLRLLLDTPENSLSSFNLRTTRKILCTYLRNNVLCSQQISNQSKLVYLNTLKCNSLRCINSRLAIRLQMTG